MTRGLGAVDALRDVLPEAALAVMVAVTHLGDPAVLLALALAVYWVHDRRAGAFVLAATLGALALTVGLKAFFALPRPPEAGRLVAADGYGFPSGHAVGATVAWGALALRLDAGERRRRGALAGVAVAGVAVSRVALGVHFAVDVLAGVALGLAYLAALVVLSGDEPSRAFAAALVAAIAGVVASGASADAVVLSGMTIGGLLAWHAADPPISPGRREGGVSALLGGLVVVGVVLGYDEAMALPAAFALGAVAAVLAVGIPALVARARELAASARR